MIMINTSVRLKIVSVNGTDVRSPAHAALLCVCVRILTREKAKEERKKRRGTSKLRTREMEIIGVKKKGKK
jgi:hypothetical protein